MSPENKNTVMIFENLDLEKVISTIGEMLEKGKEVGSFGKHLYCRGMGTRCYLDTAVQIQWAGGRITSTQQVFVSKGIHYKRNVSTWEEI